jgi:hypothetical protein
MVFERRDRRRLDWAHFRQTLDGHAQRRQTGRVDSVVVRQQKVHCVAYWIGAERGGENQG